MSEMIKKYVDSVLEKLVTDEKMKLRIEKDLYSHINVAAETEDIDTFLKKMGAPENVALEFMDSIYQDKGEVIERLIREKTRADKLENGYYEYKSKIHLFGLPLVHIKFSIRNSMWHRKSKKPAVAKGIIAIGDISKGVISIGAIAFGGICFGALSFGVMSFGGFAIGILLAIGGLAMGTLAIGGFAVGLGAIGGFALGKIAIGGFAKGTVAIGEHASGKHIISNVNSMNTSKQQVYDLIKSGYPHLSDRIIKIFTFFFQSK